MAVTGLGWETHARILAQGEGSLAQLRRKVTDAGGSVYRLANLLRRKTLGLRIRLREARSLVLR